MDYYLLCPSYLNRYLHVRRLLRPGKRLLNVGCGKGAFNSHVSDRFDDIIGVDINATDIHHAQSLSPMTYIVMDAKALSFPSCSFDAVICIETIEHIDNAKQAIAELVRVLRPGGQLVLSFPHTKYPWTYDPINALLRTRFGFGAHAYGHTALPHEVMIIEMLEKAGLHVRAVHHVSHHLIGLLEMYWVGFLQSLLKENARNSAYSYRRPFLHYDHAYPRFLTLPARIAIALDDFLFGRSVSCVTTFIDAEKEANRHISAEEVPMDHEAVAKYPCSNDPHPAGIKPKKNACA